MQKKLKKRAGIFILFSFFLIYIALSSCIYFFLKISLVFVMFSVEGKEKLPAQQLLAAWGTDLQDQSIPFQFYSFGLRSKNVFFFFPHPKKVAVDGFFLLVLLLFCSSNFKFVVYKLLTRKAAPAASPNFCCAYFLRMAWRLAVSACCTMLIIFSAHGRMSPSVYLV